MKKKYQAPLIEIIEVENENGVMAGSDGSANSNINDFSGKNPMFSTGTRSSSSSSLKAANPMQDLEDILNDLFTVTK